MTYTDGFLTEINKIFSKIEVSAVEEMVRQLDELRERGGRLFFLGVGGGAANASHAVNDFRRIAEIECYAPTDNIAEITARTNDCGWESVFVEWLKGSRLNARDGIFIFSVGGGEPRKNISANLAEAVLYAKKTGAKVFGVVGRDGGVTAQHANACIVVPTVNPDRITTHTEILQAVLWHILVNHPKLNRCQNRLQKTSGVLP